MQVRSANRYQSQGSVCRLVCFGIVFLFSVCNAHSSRRLPLAGIFGIGGNKENANEQTKQQKPPPFQLQRQSSVPPPPPPDRIQGSANYPPRRPPPPRPPKLVRQTARSVVPPALRNKDPNYPPRGPPPPPPKPKNEGQANQTAIAEQEEEPLTRTAETNQESPVETEKELNFKESGVMPPPPQPQWENDPYQMQQQQPPPPQSWMPPPPMEQGGWGPPPVYYDGYDNGDPMYIQGELDQSLERENDLIGQLDNLTAAVLIMEQREELHIRQLDVLTERIMDIEAQAAEDRNQLAEYEVNCTALGLTIATLQDEAGEWKKRCSEFSERSDKDQEEILELKRLIKEKQNEAEDIAIAIENVRLAEKRRERSKGRAKQKSLLAKFFALFFSETDDYEEMTREDAYDMAKSTLLRALQTERGNVHELEVVAASLQQNNSAISEMVESRDSIIDELNNRISVFEEDKVVLKAALRQLQKEIREETPKAQKLMHDLAQAEKASEMLRDEMDALIRTHQEELSMLQQTLSMKQKTISESESNLTAIGTYVDRLEDRLTSFAVTRRDMEAREKKCKGMEEAAAVVESQKAELEEKIESFTKEQDELKKLLEELVSERAKLQKDNRKLATDSEFRIAEQEQLQTKCESLECEVKQLTEAVDDLRSKHDILTPALEAAEQSNAALEGSAEKAVELENVLGKFQSENKDLQAELQLLKDENERLEANFVNVSGILSELEEKAKQQKVHAENKSPINDPQPSRNVSPLNDLQSSRNVPFRKVRKQLSKATGIHGIITPSSKGAKREVKLPFLGSRKKNRPTPLPPTGQRPPPPDQISKRGPPNPPPLPP